MRKRRIKIPTRIRRELLLECGFKCSMTLCTERSNLEAHHINFKPSDNGKQNLIMFCRNHHAMANNKEIDKKACLLLKEMLRRSMPVIHDMFRKSPSEGELIIASLDKSRKDNAQSGLEKISNYNKSQVETKDRREDSIGR